jgi:hypothetical protein
LYQPFKGWDVNASSAEDQPFAFLHVPQGLCHATVVFAQKAAQYLL